jgi:CDP-diacylglycerol--glycerol-3-phosphate 3-phosphatidyltransferase
MKQHVPNILSASRIVLSPLLLIPAIVSRPAIYFPLYSIIFLTDVLDGKIARRLHLQSELGAKLDSVGDMLFFICAFGSIIISPLVVETRILICMAIGLALHFLISIVTFAKFKLFMLTMHTYYAKLLMLSLALIIPITIAAGRISFPVVAVYLGFTVLYTIESMVLILSWETYNGRHRGLLAEKMIAKQGEDGWFNKLFFIFH